MSTTSLQIYFSFQRAEPIHTLLESILDKHSVYGSLRSYFFLMKDVFILDENKDELRLVVDVWSEANEGLVVKMLPKREEPEIQNYPCLKAKVIGFDDFKVIVNFNLPSSNPPRVVKAVVPKEDYLCKRDKNPAGELLINVVYQKDVAFACNWRCTAAWRPGDAMVNLKGRFMRGSIIARFPDGIKRKMKVRRSVLIVSNPDVSDKPIDVYFDVEFVHPTGEYCPTLVWDRGQRRPTKEDIAAYGLVEEIDEVLENKSEPIDPLEFSYDGQKVPADIIFNLTSVMTEPLFLINKNHFNLICQTLDVEEKSVCDKLRQALEKHARLDMAYLLAETKKAESNQ